MAQAAAVQIKLLLIFGPHGFYINANVGLLVVFMARTDSHTFRAHCMRRPSYGVRCFAALSPEEE